MRPYLFLLLLTLFSCNAKRDNKSKKPITIDTTTTGKKLTDTTYSKTEIIERFIDSLNIGKKRNAKIEILKYRTHDDTYVNIKFFTKSARRWHLQDQYLYECDALMGLEPHISDFNNDGFNDMTFISATAARGANEVRRLFIYDDRHGKLISIKNSQDYPNMLYNKELDCIDAFLVHGGTTTVFAKIKGDSLKEFASVNNSDYRTVREIDRSGKEHVLSKDTIIDPDDIYIRYINYKPIKEYQ